MSTTKHAVLVLLALVLAVDAQAMECSNVNLLRSTQAIDGAVWDKSGVVVTVDTDTSPSCSQDAEHIYTFLAGGAIRQSSTVLLPPLPGPGAELYLYEMATTWTRYSVSATFVGLTYTCSIYLKCDEEDIPARLRIDVDPGGHVRCSVEDTFYLASYSAWGVQLEQGPLSDYRPRI